MYAAFIVSFSLLLYLYMELILCIVEQMELSGVMNSILENQAELMKEIKSLVKEN